MKNNRITARQSRAIQHEALKASLNEVYAVIEGAARNKQGSVEFFGFLMIDEIDQLIEDGYNIKEDAQEGGSICYTITFQE